MSKALFRFFETISAKIYYIFQLYFSFEWDYRCTFNDLFFFLTIPTSYILKDFIVWLIKIKLKQSKILTMVWFDQAIGLHT